MEKKKDDQKTLEERIIFLSKAIIEFVTSKGLVLDEPQEHFIEFLKRRFTDLKEIDDMHTYYELRYWNYHEAVYTELLNEWDPKKDFNEYARNIKNYTQLLSVDSDSIREREREVRKRLKMEREWRTQEFQHDYERKNMELREQELRQSEREQWDQDRDRKLELERERRFQNK
ncbi:MAG: hypothetical protein QM526_00515 [Alphaproteobacteria bacterium]|nr:hypothetical protein [Alphaproteobacteria bacterium]